MNCVNIKSQEFQELLETTKLPSLLLEMRIAKWQEQNGLDRFPTSDEVLIRTDVVELFESNPELANEVYEALGFKKLYKEGRILNVSYLSDVTRNLKLYSSESSFNSSKVKRTVFHISKNKINKFTNGNIGTNTKALDTVLGHFFSEDYSSIAGMRERKDDLLQINGQSILGHEVHEVSINLQNPYVLNSFISSLPEYLGVDKTLPLKEQYKQSKEKLIKEGYDGVIYGLEFDGQDVTYGFVVFDEKNIKVENIKNDKEEIEKNRPSDFNKTTQINYEITLQQKQQAQQLYSQYIEQNPNGNVEQFKSWLDNNQSDVQYQKQIDLQAEQDTVLEEFANNLSERFNIPFDLVSEEDARAIFPEYTNEPAFFDPKTKKAYLVKGKANKTSAIHEIFTHPFLLQIEKTNPTLYKNLLKEAKDNKSVVDYVDNLYGTNQNNDHEYIARAIDLAVQGELDQQKDKTLLERIQDFFNQLSDYLKKLFNIPEVFSSAISPSITLQQLTQFAMYGKGKIDLNPAQENIEYSLKATNVIVKNLDKIKQWEKNKSISEDVLWKKIQELGVPKEQLELVKNSEGNTVEEKLLNFVNQYSYTVEINTAEEKLQSPSDIYNFNLNGDNYSTSYYQGIEDNYTTYLKNGNEISYEEYNKAQNEYLKIFQETAPTQHYSNLTVPGGTNYTENEIATPAITPSIKGHAQFATDNGIGWFRSDDKTIVETPETVEDELDLWTAKKVGDKIIIPTNKPTKTRRILEVQSEEFQKHYNKFESGPLTGREHEYERHKDSNQEWIYSRDKITISKKEYDIAWEDYLNNNEDKFLALLHKNNNWVTFFVKSIIQDSAKKGYEKVLFPKGDTAAKIEGHQTLEDFKKQKEDRIKRLEKVQEVIIINEKKYDNDLRSQGAPDSDTYFKNEEEANKVIDNLNNIINKSVEALSKETNEEAIFYIEGNISEAQDEKTNILNALKKYQSKINDRKNEINQLKQELADVESGQTQLSSIAKFYENTVTNILKKQGYNPVEITDEYGNTWNEVTIDENRDNQNILFQKPQENDSFQQFQQSLNNPNTNPVLQGNQKPDVILPIGTSGSGKSTFIKSLPQENLIVIEPDAMRVEFTGDMNDKSKDKEIYEEAAKRAVTAIGQGKQVVFDTTNLTKEKRLPFIEAIKKEIPNANIQYKLMELNPELAKQRIKADIAAGKNRANVPDATIDRHAESYKQMLEDIKNEPISNFDVQQEQVKKFAELQERLNNKEFLEGAKNAFESSEELQKLDTQEQYNDYIARVSLGIIKNPTSGEYNYESKVKDIVYHGTKHLFNTFSNDVLGKTTGSPSATLGHFFTNNEKNAFHYTSAIFYIYPAVLDVKGELLKLKDRIEYKERELKYSKGILAELIISIKKLINILTFSNNRILSKKLQTITDELNHLYELRDNSILFVEKATSFISKYENTIGKYAGAFDVSSYMEDLENANDAHIKEITKDLSDLSKYFRKVPFGYDFRSTMDFTVKRVVLNMKSPSEFSDKYQEYVEKGNEAEFKREETYFNRIKDSFDSNKDSVIIKDSRDPLNADIFIVKDSEQIHILGSKQDIEGFKSWVDNSQTNVQSESLHIDPSFFQKSPSEQEEYLTNMFENLQEEEEVTESVEVEDVIDSIFQGSLSEVIDNMIHHMDLSDNTSEILLKILSKTNAEIEYVSASELTSTDTIMEYDHGRNVIKVSLERLNEYSPAEISITLLHEMVHSITVESLRNPKTFEQKDLVDLIESFINDNKDLSEEWGMSSTFEFVAELYSNPEFRDKVKEASKTKWWSDFINAVRRLLGLPYKRNYNNLVERVIEFVDNAESSETTFNQIFERKSTEKESKYANLTSYLNIVYEEIQDKVGQVADRIRTSQKFKSQEDKKEYLENIEKLIEFLEEHHETGQWLGVLEYTKLFLKTTQQVNNLLEKITPQDIENGDLGALLHRYEEYLAAYDLLEDMKGLLDFANRKSDELSEKELEDVKEIGDFLRSARIVKEGIDSKILHIKKRQLIKFYSNPLYNTQVTTNWRILLSNEYRDLPKEEREKISEAEYISQKLNGEYKQDYEADLKNSAEKLVYDPLIDISWTARHLYDPFNTNQPIIQILTNFIGEIRQRIVERSREKSFTIDELHKKLIKEKGNRKPSALFKNLYQQDKDGNYFLKGEYDITFYDAYREEYLPILLSIQEIYKLFGNKFSEETVAELNKLRIKKSTWEKKYLKEDRLTPKDEFKTDLSALSPAERQILEEFINISKGSHDKTEGRVSLIRNASFKRGKKRNNIEFLKLPAINKTDIERRIETDAKGIIKDKTEDLFTIRTDDVGYAKEAITAKGRPVAEIPIYFRGNLDPSQQSLDLASMYKMEFWNGEQFKESTQGKYTAHMILDVVGSNDFLKKSRGVPRLLQNAFAKRQPNQKVEGTSTNTYHRIQGLIERNFGGITTYYAGKFLGKDVNKMISNVQAMTGVLGMSFNAAAGVANLFNGFSNLIMEAVGNNIVGRKHLMKAESKYMLALANGEILSDLTNPVKKSFINQLNEYFDVFGGLMPEQQSSLRNNFMRKFASLGMLNWMNDSGEHMLHSILNMAILDSIKVMNKDGKYINKQGEVVSEENAASLLDMFYLDKNGHLAVHEAVGKTKYNLTIDFQEGGKVHIKNLIKKKIFDIYGVYDTNFKNELSKLWGGKLLMTFKNFFLSLFNYRFAGIEYSHLPLEEREDWQKFYSTADQEYIEGIYTTFVHTVVIPIFKGFKIALIKENYNKLTDYQKSNLRKALFEFAMTNVLLPAIGLLLAAIDGDDDDKLWFAIYINRRLIAELAQFRNPVEATKLLTNPIASAKFVRDAIGLSLEMVRPWRWDERAGDGELRIRKRFKRVVPIWNQLEKNYRQLYNIQFNN